MANLRYLRGTGSESERRSEAHCFHKCSAVSRIFCRCAIEAPPAILKGVSSERKKCAHTPASISSEEMNKH